MTIKESSTTIGIDLGTSHCTAAVWDSTRGHPKWMRLSAAYPEATKEGRIMPSAILLLNQKAADRMNLEETRDVGFILFPNETQNNGNSSSTIVAAVGKHAMNVIEKATETMMNSRNYSSYPSLDQISAALITSSKRLLGLSRVSDDLRSSLSMNISNATADVRQGAKCKGGEDQEELMLNIQPIGHPEVVPVKPSQATTILLLAIRQCCERYLKINSQKKNLKIPSDPPGSFSCTNAVIGVPAHYGRLQRSLVVQCAHKAGFTGQVSVITESTAASVAYGIFVSQQSTEKRILVFDSGGGTTDLTILSMAGSPGSQESNEPNSSLEESQRFRVVATEGDANLGGDDMDAALLAVALTKVGKSEKDLSHRRQLLNDCRRAKERLCGDVDHGYQHPESSVVISVLGSKCTLTQNDLEKALKPWIERATKLVRRALERYATEMKLKAAQDAPMNEVILVGGATRVPAVRTMLREIFPPPIPADLCLSVNAMAAVAQGAAIQAAILSGRVPRHEVRSAMMLDTVPHAIGVLLPDSETFVEIIPRDSPLPAQGSAEFQLADALQPGVSFTAVEYVDEGQLYPKLGEFNFLLARLSEEKIKAIGGVRSVEIQMTLRESGEFVVSVYDENDPEHIGRSKSRGARRQKLEKVPVLAFHQDDDSFSFEQIMLIISCFVLLCAYVAARIYFRDELAVYSD